MKIFNVVVLAVCLSVFGSVAYAGGEIQARSIPAPVYVSPAPVYVNDAYTVQRGGFLGRVSAYFSNRLCDVGDVVWQSADMVVGIVGVDLADDNCSN